MCNERTGLLRGEKEWPDALRRRAGRIVPAHKFKLSQYLLRASHDWVPAGKAESYQLSAVEQTRRNDDVASCVGELSSWLAQINETPPRLRLTRQERMLQLVARMEERGGHLVRVEIVVTSAA